jgi:exodeoxyribonuclease VII small subunit
MAREQRKSAPEQAAPDGATPESFEADLSRLEDIVHRLEEGNLSLDESLKLYEDGVAAYRRCHKTLDEAELKVRKLVETVEGELKEEPFEPPEQ